MLNGVAGSGAANRGALDQEVNRGIVKDFRRSEQAAERAADNIISKAMRRGKEERQDPGGQQNEKHKQASSAAHSKEDLQHQELRRKGEELRRQDEEKNQM